MITKETPTLSISSTTATLFRSLRDSYWAVPGKLREHYGPARCNLRDIFRSREVLGNFQRRLALIADYRLRETLVKYELNMGRMEGEAQAYANDRLIDSIFERGWTSLPCDEINEYVDDLEARLRDGERWFLLTQEAKSDAILLVNNDVHSKTVRYEGVEFMDTEAGYEYLRNLLRQPNSDLQQICSDLRGAGDSMKSLWDADISLASREMTARSINVLIRDTLGDPHDASDDDDSMDEDSD